MLPGKRKRSDDDTLGGGLEGDPDDPSASSNHIKEPEKWTPETHRTFVEAVYEAGVAQSSPSVIFENMANRPVHLTGERIKSHLQKYRKNKQRSKDDFMEDYDTFMRKAQTVGGAGTMGAGKPSGGETAAFLSHSVLREGEIKSAHEETTSSVGIAKESHDNVKNYVKHLAGTHIPFPQLTEEEKRSPLGKSLLCR